MGVIEDSDAVLSGPDVQAIAGGAVISGIVLIVGWPLGIFAARRATKLRKA